MDIFGSSADFFKPCGIGLGAPCNFVERRKRLLHFRRGENANGFKSFGPGTIDGDFVGQETAIERKRTLERVELFVRCALEASAPQPVVFAFGHSMLVGQAFLPVPVVSSFTEVWTDRNVCPTQFPSAFALGRTVTGSANKLMKPSASFGL